MSFTTYVGAIALVSTLLLPTPGQAAPLFTITELSNNFTPADINNHGQIAGWRQVGDGRTNIALYSDGAVSDLGSLGGDYTFAHSLNDAGEITGDALIGADVHGFVYRNGNLTDLGAGTVGWSINAAGDVVGAKLDASGSAGLLYRNGILTVLPHLGTGNVGFASDINDAGVIVGDSSTTSGWDSPRHPVIYSDDGPIDLGTLPAYARKSAEVINNQGRIAGTTGDWNGIASAFVYENGVSTDLGNFGGAFLTIGGINEAGYFVGTALGPQDQGIGFIYLNGGLVDLNTLVDPATGWRISGAADINDLGQIAAWGYRGTEISALRLDLAGVIPEPDAIGLLVPGLLLLLGARRRGGPHLASLHSPSSYTAR